MKKSYVSNSNHARKLECYSYFLNIFNNLLLHTHVLNILILHSTTFRMLPSLKGQWNRMLEYTLEIAIDRVHTLYF